MSIISTSSSSDFKIGSKGGLKGKFSRLKKFETIVWFLDEDLKLSAKYLSNKYLSKNIHNLTKILVCVRLYMVGIRNRRMFSLLFSNEKREESMEKYFPGFCGKYRIKFTFYDHRLSKWARCRKHYEYLEQYLMICLDEWFRRTRKAHKIYEMSEYLIYDNSLKDKLPKLNCKKIVLPWQLVPRKFQKKDVFLAFRNYYKKVIGPNYMDEYGADNANVPDFLIDPNVNYRQP